MNLPHQHEMKMGHPHQNPHNMNQNHEVKMNLHDVSDVKMSMHQHEVKMHHEMVMHHLPVMEQQTHLIEVHIPAPQELPTLEINNVNIVNNVPEPPPQQQQNQQQNQLQQQQNQLQQQNQQMPPPLIKPKKEKKQTPKLQVVDNKKKKEAIDGQAREVIFKVIKFFESEKQNRGYAFPVENVVKRACAATGLSESTIKRIKRDGLRAEATQTRMQGPKKKRVRKTKVQLDYFQLCALKGIVNSYSVKKEVPTLGKILAAAKHELNYRGGKESLRLILLNKLGIKFKKCEKKIKKPPEQPPPQIPQMQTVMQQQPMQHMKVMENQCVYTNMIPPVSY